MTYEQLKDYRVLAAQIKNFETECPYYKGVKYGDKIQNNKIKDTTAENYEANLMLMGEYFRLLDKITPLNDFLCNIEDETIKAIAFRHFVWGYSFRQISKCDDIHYSKDSCSRILKKYIKDNPFVDKNGQ